LAEHHAHPADIVVIGASAGGLEALRGALGGVDGRMSAAVFVVVHTSAGAAHVLASILERVSGVPASYPSDGEPIAGGHIYVAPPDHHMLIEDGHVRITRGPKENGFRPAVDPLFRTAAAAYGPRIVGVILSGGQNDGTLGMAAIKRAGGVTIAQSPDDAIVSNMPESAITHVGMDHVLTSNQIQRFLITRTRKPGKAVMGTRGRRPSIGTARRQSPDSADVGTDLFGAGAANAPPSAFVCPECGGALWEAEENGILRYRCHVGHVFTGEALLNEQGLALEQAMWTALRSLEEGAALRLRMADHAQQRGMAGIARRYAEQSDEFKQRAAVIRKALVVDRDTAAADRSAAAIEGRARRSGKR
jgi:two-component system chemotaxis response regulator CheB